MTTPYIGFSNETLSKLPIVKPGDRILCAECLERHELKAADNGSTLLMFYECGDKLKLGAINERLIVHVSADVAGAI